MLQSLKSGDTAAALSWLKENPLNAEQIELYKVYTYFAGARALLAVGHYTLARELLSRLADFAKNYNRPIDECEATVLLSVLNSFEGHRSEAEEALEAALAIAEKYKFILPVADEGAAVLPVLRRIMSQMQTEGYKGLSREFVNEVIFAAHINAKKNPDYLRKKADAVLKPVKLSRRQKDMITLLSQGLRTSEICRLTGLTLATVKTHLYLAYQKLEVTNAMDAVIKAHEIGAI
jgi:LuxR family maltose regulon positive regulatory protein